MFISLRKNKPHIHTLKILKSRSSTEKTVFSWKLFFKAEEQNTAQEFLSSTRIGPLHCSKKAATVFQIGKTAEQKPGMSPDASGKPNDAYKVTDGKYKSEHTFSTKRTGLGVTCKIYIFSHKSRLFLMVFPQSRWILEQGVKPLNAGPEPLMPAVHCEQTPAWKSVCQLHVQK